MQTIDPRHLLVGMARILKRLKIPYMITGGIAVLVWGRPRFTADIDIVVELKEGNSAAVFLKALKSFSKAGYIDEEAMTRAILTGGEFNFIDGETGVKVDFWVLKKNNPFDRSRSKRKKTKMVLGEKIYFTSPEDLVLIKLKWYKESHSDRQFEDVQSILKKWALNLGVSEILERIKALTKKSNGI